MRLVQASIDNWWWYLLSHVIYSIYISSIPPVVLSLTRILALLAGVWQSPPCFFSLLLFSFLFQLSYLSLLGMVSGEALKKLYPICRQRKKPLPRADFRRHKNSFMRKKIAYSVVWAVLVSLLFCGGTSILTLASGAVLQKTWSVFFFLSYIFSGYIKLRLHKTSVFFYFLAEDVGVEVELGVGVVVTRSFR